MCEVKMGENEVKKEGVEDEKGQKSMKMMKVEVMKRKNDRLVMEGEIK